MTIYKIDCIFVIPDCRFLYKNRCKTKFVTFLTETEALLTSHFSLLTSHLGMQIILSFGRGRDRKLETMLFSSLLQTLLLLKLFASTLSKLSYSQSLQLRFQCKIILFANCLICSTHTLLGVFPLASDFTATRLSNTWLRSWHVLNSGRCKMNIFLCNAKPQHSYLYYP